MIIASTAIKKIGIIIIVRIRIIIIKLLSTHYKVEDLYFVLSVVPNI